MNQTDILNPVAAEVTRRCPQHQDRSSYACHRSADSLVRNSPPGRKDHADKAVRAPRRHGLDAPIGGLVGFPSSPLPRASVRQRWLGLTAALAIFTSSSPVAVSAETRAGKTAKPQIEVCFVLDTTGSMSGLIEGAKQKIWSIANEIISAKPTPDIKFGLVGYRDRGDEYITKVFNLTDDIDGIYAHLQAFKAAGGGDTPESVNEALEEAVNKMAWSTNRSVLKIIFLVGDAPPHLDYQDGPKYPDICKAAIKRDLIINTIQCGMMAETTPIWKEIAQLSEGSYAAIGQTGNMIAIATPVDKELAELNRKIGGTLIAYGDESVRRYALSKQVASEAAPASVAADRLSFNFTSGKAVQGGGELLDAVANGSVKLESMQKEKLPAELQKLNAEELKAYVAKQQKQRAELQSQVQVLNEKRKAYLETEKKRLAAKGSNDAFDGKVAEMIKTQVAKKGLEYGK